MRLFFLLLMTIVAANTYATTYYLSAHRGNDNFDGKSKSSPWRSLKKISEPAVLTDGDSILLERGSIFYGQLIITNSKIYAGAYGSGDIPVINGAVELTHWETIEKNIWKATCENCTHDPDNLFMDRIFQPLGRYPNDKYLSVSGSRGKQSFDDTTLPFANGYWNGAEIVVRSSRWTLDKLPVREFQNKTFTLTRPASYAIQKEFGYFIQKHKATLDKSGEWFFDPSTRELLLYLDAGANPNNHKIEISMNELGLTAKRVHDITITNLSFKHHTKGIKIEDCSTILLQNISISDSGNNGLEIISSRAVNVKNSIIARSNNNGVVWNNSEGIFSNNSIRSTGAHAGRGTSGNGTYIGMAISSPQGSNKTCIVENNKIDSTGYIGIDFRSGNTLIKNNTISNFCMIKDDGAGIYTWHNTQAGNTIDGNTIRHGIGAPNGTVNSTELFASGIYIDDQSRNVIIKNNHISFCATAGIFLHNAKNITLTGNTAFSNGYSISNKEKGQLYIKLDTLGEMHGNTSLFLDVSQNTWRADREATYCIFLSAKKKQDLQKLGRIDQNTFQAIQPNQVVGELFDDKGLCFAPQEFSLEEWRIAYGHDIKSVYSTQKKKNPATLGGNLIRNGDLNLGSKGWIVWPDKATIVLEKKITGNPSLKVSIPAGTEALLYHAGFPLSKNKLYRLSFTAVGSSPSKLEFVPLMAGSPWRALGIYTCFSIKSSPKTFTYLFTPTENCTEARVNFKSNAHFWIQDVSLCEVIDPIKL